MFKRHVTPIVFALVVVLVAPVSTMFAEDTADPGMGSTLIGKIASETNAPVGGATLIAYHLSTGNVVRSDPTLDNGRLEMTGLESGYYDLAIETPGGLFVVNQVVNVLPDGKLAINLKLSTQVTDSEGPRDFPGSDIPASGIAQLIEKGNKKVIGWAIAGGIGGALLLGGGSSSSSSSSPSNPN